MYERFILLESFCAKGSFISEFQDKFIAERLSKREVKDENNGQQVKVGNKYYSPFVVATLVSNLTDQTKEILAKFFDLLSDDEISEINCLLAEDIKSREVKSFNGVNFAFTTIKLKALLKAIQERALQNSSDGTMF